MKRRWRVGALVVFLIAAALGGEKLWAQKQDDSELLRVREQVWRAWFAGDTNTLRELVPAETIVMSGGRTALEASGGCAADFDGISRQGRQTPAIGIPPQRSAAFRRRRDCLEQLFAGAGS